MQTSVSESANHVSDTSETSRTYTATLDLLTTYHPEHLITLTSNAATLNSGINQATRAFTQVSMPRVRSCASAALLADISRQVPSGQQ